ncbi:MAG TPA: C25 family cysteine peptidase [Clostridiales bacterium]|nr:C25 family cysteine peptidase [Clostridiales bacterium]HQP70530.1 C25 family cysteine peptidase [Clostridiales bacterium]
MKKILLVLTLICLISLYSGTIMLSDNGISGFKVGSNSADGFEFDLNLEKFDFTPVITEKGEFVQLGFEGAKFSQEIGSPKLPVLKELIEFPHGSNPEVSVVSFQEKEIFLDEFGIFSKIIPVQPSYSKSAKPEDIKFVKNEAAYLSDRFNEFVTAEISKSGTMRGVEIGVLKVSPVRYNPVRNSMKVYTELKLRVTFSGIKSDLAINKAEHYSPFFENQFAKTINYIPSKSKEDLTRYPVTYLIVANEVLLGNAKLDEFIEWKTQKGFNVITQFFSSSSTTSTVDTWVEEQYNNLTPKPTFLLIIGDQSGTYVVPTEQNPALGSTGGVTVSDLMYSVIGATSNTNRIPSIYVGRFSVNNLDELNAQIDKTIWYEKNQFDTAFNPGQDFTYLSRVLGVSGVDGNYAASYGNPQIRYGMSYYFKNGYLLPVDGTNVNITGIPYYYPASANSSADAAIVAEVSAGVAFYNYTAHGSNSSFSDPTFTINNVNGLSNAGEYPLVVGNCCLTGSFRDTECFGESWLNAANKGGIGFIGASMSTYWDEDLAMGTGEAVTGDITPPYTPDSYGMYDGAMRMNYPTQGAIRFSGLMAVEELNTSYTSSYWSAYHLFGDPSLMVYMGIPGENTVTCNPVITPGVTYFTVQALEGSYVSLTDDEGILHGAAVADEYGYAVVTIDPFLSGNAYLTVTSQFKKPYFKTLPVEELTTPYLLLNNYSVSDINFGSNGTIGIELKNIGVLPSQGISVKATSLNKYINITDSLEAFADIAASDSLNKSTAFYYSLSQDVPDKEEIRIDLVINDSSKRTYYSSIKFMAGSPNLSYEVSYTGDFIKPGDNRDITVKVINSGSGSISDITAVLSETTGADVTVSSSQNIPSISGSSETDIIFNVDFSSSIQNGAHLKFSLDLESAGGYSNSFPFDIFVGMTESFETGDFATNPWYFSGDLPWTADNTVFHTGLYSARSGAITDYQSSEMNIDFNFYEDGSISFYKKVSSESNYDVLSFLIDGTEQQKWSGERDWSYENFPVTSGIHTFTWVYSKDVNTSNGSDCAWIDNILVSGAVTGIEETTSVPDVPVLYKNYPNPFNPSTLIRFSIPVDDIVRLSVYNSNGQLLKDLFSGKALKGIHEVNFRADDLNSGIYFYTLEASGRKLTSKMLLIK